MKTLSNGWPNTLGSYRKMSVTLWGENSGAVKFIDGKIADSSKGEKEEVIADETQMLYALGHADRGY